MGKAEDAVRRREVEAVQQRQQAEEAAWGTMSEVGPQIGSLMRDALANLEANGYPGAQLWERSQWAKNWRERRKGDLAYWSFSCYYASVDTDGGAEAGYFTFFADGVFSVGGQNCNYRKALDIIKMAATNDEKFPKEYERESHSDWRVERHYRP